MKIRLRGNLQEQKIQCVSARGPQLRAGRKMAAVLIHPNDVLLQLLHRVQLIQILRNHREQKKKKIRLAGQKN